MSELTTEQFRAITRQILAERSTKPEMVGAPYGFFRPHGGRRDNCGKCKDCKLDYSEHPFRRVEGYRGPEMWAACPRAAQ
jgi:hypothetical protein